MSSVALDGNPETHGISPAPSSVIQGENMVIAITAHQIKAMHSYSIKCRFDSSIVSFNQAAAKLSPLTPAFIEHNNGTLAAFLAIPKGQAVEIAATQAGNNPLNAVSGDGILGYLHFTAKNSGNPNIVITEALIIDPQGESTFALIR